MRDLGDYLDRIMDVLDDGIYISDRLGTTLLVNRRYEELTGLKRDDLIGKSVRDLVKEGKFDVVLNPEIVRTGLPKTVIQKTKVGKKVVLNGRPVFDEAGKVALVVTFVRDITSLSKIKDQLAYQQELLERFSEGEFRARGERVPQRPVFVSRPMQNVLELIASLAATDVTVLLLGETGVGKDVLARHIHEKSGRAGQAFFKVDCAAIPPNLVESELFGYDPGAFSGADRKGKPGFFEMAHKGTIFLDEIAELSLGMQGKLLRVLQDRELLRVGSTRVKQVDVRIIAATNRKLEEAVAEGAFRRDLFYRLQVAVVHIPPLRERKEDILPLVQHFLTIFNAKYRKSLAITPEAEAVLEQYSWAGNVRELENLIHGLVIMLHKERAEAADLPPNMLPPVGDGQPKSLFAILADMERELLRKGLEACGSVSALADHFHVDRTTIFRKLKKHALR